jgi:Ca2+-binding EF-hand superfamily protein
MKTIPVSFLVAGMLLPAVCHAQPQEPPMDKKNQERPPVRPFIEKWKAADKNQDGFISRDEFATIPRIQNLPDEKRARVFKRLDKDADDKLSRDELAILNKPHDGNPGQPGERMKRLWELDVDKNGGISFEEFKAGPMFKKLSPEKQQEVFRRLDSDSNGVIDPKDRPQRPFKRHGQPDGKHPDQGDKPEGINRKLDLNGDGALSFEEFRAGPATKDLTEDRQEARFELLDRNHDLKISPEDFPPHAPPSPH